MKGAWLLLTLILKEHVYVEILERFQQTLNQGLLICILPFLTVFGLVHDKKCFC